MTVRRLMGKRAALCVLLVLGLVAGACGDEPAGVAPNETTISTSSESGMAGDLELDVVCDRVDPPARVSGRVWHDVVSDGRQTDGEAGVAGLVVVLEDGDGEVARVATAGDGSFEFGDLGYGPHSLWLDDGSVPAGWGMTIASPWHFRLLPGDHLTIPSFGIARTGTVGGVVFHDANQDGIHDPTEEGLEGVVVWGESPGTLGSPVIAETDPAGQFDLEVLPGAWDLNVQRGSVPDFMEPVVALLPVSLQVGEGEVVDDIVLAYAEPPDRVGFDPDPGRIPHPDPDPSIRMVGAAGDDPMAGSILSLMDRHCLTVNEARHRLAVSEGVRGVAPVARTDPEFAGIWLDNAVGQLVIGFTDDAEAKAAELEERFDLPSGTIVGVTLEFSYQRLRDTQLEIGNLLKDEGFENWGSYISEPENRVYITVLDPERLRTLIDEKYPAGMVHVQEGSVELLDGVDLGSAPDDQ